MGLKIADTRVALEVFFIITNLTEINSEMKGVLFQFIYHR